MKIDISYEDDTQLIGIRFGKTHSLDMSTEEARMLGCLLRECALLKIGADMELKHQDSLYEIEIPNG